MRAVREYGEPLIDDPARLDGVVAVGVDETAFLAAGPRSSTQFVTGIVALPGPGRPCAQLLDTVPGRTRAAVQQWFSACNPAWRDTITTASLDPYGPDTWTESRACTGPGLMQQVAAEVLEPMR